MSARIVHLREAGSKCNATSEAKGRGKNEAYRTREHLTEAEMDKLLAALKRNRHGHRDWLIGLLIFLESRLLAPMRLSNEVFERRSCQRSRPVSDHYRRLALLTIERDTWALRRVALFDGGTD